MIGDHLHKLSDRSVPKAPAGKAAQAKQFVKWAKTVETPLVERCDKCGFDRRVGALSKIVSVGGIETVTSTSGTASAPRAEAKCANPLCATPPATIALGSREQPMPLRLKKCSRCLQVAYCSTACQKQHWKARLQRKPSDRLTLSVV